VPSPAQIEQRTQRINACIAIMGEDGWLEGRTAKELADKWGCSYTTVRSYRSEALRVLRLNLAADLDDERNRIILRLEHCYRAAMDRKVERAVYNAQRGEVEIHETRDPDIKAAVTALRQTEHILNLKIDRSGPEDEDADAKLTDEELLASLDEARERVRARIEASEQTGANGKAAH